MNSKEKNKDGVDTREARLGVRTWIEIDKKAIANNYKVFRSLLKPETKLLSVVKSNAYGHGLIDFSKEVSKLGVDWLAVDSVIEAIKLRENGIEKPILVLGYTLPEHMQTAIDKKISLTVSSMFSLQGFQNLDLKGKLNVHVKIDSGMHRQGFMEHELAEVIEKFSALKKNIDVQGLYTHFAKAKDPENRGDTENQVKIFKKWISTFREAGFEPIVHAAASGATLIFPETHFDMVRIGIGFHGLWPSEEVKNGLESKITLKPTMSWKTIVSEVKDLPAGASVGYDFTKTFDKPAKIAVCPIGYWHGYFRCLSNVGVVLVNGVRAKVVGRISMDMITIDVSNVPNVLVGDEVVLIGQSGNDYIGAHEIADIGNLSVYEFVTRINPLIKKIYI